LEYAVSLTKIASVNDATSKTTETVTITTAMAGTHAILVTGWSGTGTTGTTVTDSRGNTWQEDGKKAASAVCVTVWSSKVTSPLQVGDTITISYPSAANTYHDVLVYDTSLTATGWFLGYVAAMNATDTTTTPDSGALAVTADAIVLDATMTEGASQVLTHGGGFTQVDQVTASGAKVKNLTVSTKSITGSGTGQHTASLQVASIWNDVLVAYAPDPAGTPGTGSAVLSGNGTLSASGVAANTGTGSHLSWAPPTLTSPTTITVTDNYGTINLNTANDYIIQLPTNRAVVLPGGLNIVGGRNVVCIGGTVDVQDGTVLATGEVQRRGLYLKGQAGTIHVEGVKFLSSTQGTLTEGVNLDQRLGATVQLQTIWMQHLFGSYSGHHADGMQSWAGPDQLLIDDMWIDTGYQGMFLLPLQQWTTGTVPSKWDFRRVSILGDSGSGYGMWAPQSYSWPWVLSDVQVNMNNRTSRGQVLWDPQGLLADVAVIQTTPPSRATTAGYGYVSPGYGSTPSGSTGSGSGALTAIATVEDATSTTTEIVTITTAMTGTHAVLATVWSGTGSGGATVVDSRGNTWQLDGHNTAAGLCINTWSSKVATKLQPGDTVTITYPSTANTYHDVAIYSANLATTGWYLGGSSAANDANTTTAPDTGTYVIGQSCLALSITATEGSGQTLTQSGSYTLVDQLSSVGAKTKNMTLAVMRVTGSADIRHQASLSVPSIWNDVVAAYKEAAATSVYYDSVDLGGEGILSVTGGGGSVSTGVTPVLIGQLGDGSSKTAETVTITTAMTGTHAVLATGWSGSGGSGTTVVDSKGNTWQLDGYTTAGGLCLNVWSSKVTTKLAVGDTITLTYPSTANSFHHVLVYDASLAASSWYLGGPAGTLNLVDTTTNPDSGTYPTTEAVWGFAVTMSEGVGQALTPGDGYAQLDSLTVTGVTSTKTKNLTTAGQNLTGTNDARHTATLAVPSTWSELLAVYRPLGAVSTATWDMTWVGEPRSDGFTIAVKTTGATTVRMVVSTSADLSAGRVWSTSATPSAGAWTKHRFSGLSASTTYYYSAEIDGVLNSTRKASTATTPASGSFSFAFASCLNTGNDGGGVFEQIMSKAPTFFAHLGDWHYQNIVVNDEAQYRAAMEGQVTGSAGLRAMLASVPTTYSPSDHDSGSNDWSPGPGVQTPAFLAMYQELVPHHDFGASDASAVYQTWVVGRVRFIVLDERSHRSSDAAADNASKSMLGDAQKVWLKAQLLQPEPVKILVGDVSWIGDTAAGTDKNGDNWGSFSTERAEIAQFIRENALNVVYIHGDTHALVMDDGANSPGGIPVFGAAPLGQSTSVSSSGPFPQGSYPTAANQGFTGHQFGLCSVTDTGGTTITLAFSGIDAGGTVRLSMTKAYTVRAADAGGGSSGGGGTTSPIVTPPAVSTPGRLALPQYDIGTWSGNFTDGYGVDWVITAEEGWGGPPPKRSTIDEIPQGDGGYDAPTFDGPRVITLTGTCIAPSRYEMNRAKDRLNAVAAGRDMHVLMVTEEHITRLVYVRRTGAQKLSDTGPVSFDFALSLIAPDPRKYQALAEVVSATIVNSGGAIGRTYPRTYPRSYPTGSFVAATVNAHNTGTRETGAVITFGGGISNPGVLHLGTGASLQFALDLAVGDTLTVDLLARTAVLNGSVSRRGTLISGSSWFLLSPGDNVLRALGTPALSTPMTVTYHPAWH
jgi:phosphodiesterase/alkaline phosphatase D-like protein